jgi:outer membrane immunogenic protein
MKKLPIQKALLLASVASAALLFAGSANFSGSNANAADLALKAPPPMMPAFSWTGCYVGVHGGFAWAHNDVHETTFTTGPAFSHGLDSSGGLFGGQVGCNYQFSGTWVLGIQGDIAGADISGSASDPVAFAVSDSETVGVKTDWIASITGRLGTTFFNNQGLLYVKGGGAWVHNQWDLSNAWDNFTPNPIVGDTRSGWTVGVGGEWMITPIWSAFLEFNYYDFGNSLIATDPILCCDSGGIIGSRQTIEDVKLGLNLKLGGM